MIYEPAEDSYLLQKYVKLYAQGNVLDMGTGSGIQAKTASEISNVLAVDINEEAVQHVKYLGINCIKSDLFENVKGKFDLIIFNPPYLPEEDLEDEESKLITTGGKAGHEILDRFFKKAKGHLIGVILIVISSLTPQYPEKLISLGYKYKKLGSKKVFFEELSVYEIRYNSIKEPTGVK